jgi:hypothetical protein
MAPMTAAEARGAFFGALLRTLPDDFFVGLFAEWCRYARAIREGRLPPPSGQSADDWTAVRASVVAADPAVVAARALAWTLEARADLNTAGVPKWSHGELFGDLVERLVILANGEGSCRR